jgi:uncharacterized protein
MNGERSDRVAYLAPFFVFLAFLLLAQMVAALWEGYAWWPVAEPIYWIFPLQTVVSGIVLWKLRRRIDFGPASGFGFATLIGLLSLVVWIAPQLFFGAERRLEGFRPDFFAPEGWAYWANLGMRLIRMVIVVSFVEEIFWRGFLLRFLINEDFGKVPFGTFTWRSFLICSFAFCLIHEQRDWPASIVTGALFNVVAIRTRSLFACILTHAVTNLGLAVYILRTDQWGFW